jgi:hypothetical protein
LVLQPVRRMNLQRYSHYGCPDTLPNVELTDLATTPFVEDVPGARILGSRLRGILEKLAAAQRPSTFQVTFLTN